VLEEHLFTSYSMDCKVIKPAYIICDEDYDMYNSILQTHLEHIDVFNIGRFAQWLPHMRVEHSLSKAKQLGEILLKRGVK
jgi:hypothetical protein